MSHTRETLSALISDAIHASLDNNRIRLTPVLERRFIDDTIEHITLAGYELVLPPADLFDDTTRRHHTGVLMNPDITKISAWIPLSAELHRELVERSIGPIHGPPLPPAIELRRRLGGHPAGPYQTAATTR